MSLPSGIAFDVKRIAIIGSGPCGLAAAKYLKAQGDFDSITIYEQQGEIGGIWNCSNNPIEQQSFTEKISILSSDSCIHQPYDPNILSSPIYDCLYANIPKSLMRFSDQPFPQGTLLFPSRQTIQKYLLAYAKEVRDLVKFGIKVEKIAQVSNNGKVIWTLEAKSVMDKRAIRDTFDAVVIATGHYSTSFIPNIKNIREFTKTYPSIISHSKDYFTPQHFKNKKTIVVGNGPSGTDIAFQINHISKHNTMISVRTPTPAARLAYMACEEVSEIEEFIINERGVRFKDGRVEREVDAVIFCTGFLYDYPFLPDFHQKLTTTGFGVHGLYKHIFCIDNPTIVFPGLNIKAAPWPLAEAQAAVFAGVWSNNIQLPSTEMMHKWANELYESQGEELHTFRTPSSDGMYINELYKWVKQSSCTGKEPPFWDDVFLWQRSIFAHAKLKFEEDGYKATSLEELGLHYDPNWKAN